MQLSLRYAGQDSHLSPKHSLELQNADNTKDPGSTQISESSRLHRNCSHAASPILGRWGVGGGSYVLGQILTLTFAKLNITVLSTVSHLLFNPSAFKSVYTLGSPDGLLVQSLMPRPHSRRLE